MKTTTKPMPSMTTIRKTIKRKAEARIAREIKKGYRTNIVIREAQTILASLAGE